LLGELPRAAADASAQLGRHEHDRLATLREDLALEPLVAPDRNLADRTAPDELARPPLDLVAGYLRRVEDPCCSCAAEPRRLEAFAWLELLAQELRAAHPVEPEGALAVARAVPGVHVPVRHRALERVCLDEPRGRLGVDLLLILDLDEPPLADAPRQRG